MRSEGREEEAKGSKSEVEDGWEESMERREGGGGGEGNVGGKLEDIYDREGERANDPQARGIPTVDNETKRNRRESITTREGSRARSRLGPG